MGAVKGTGRLQIGMDASGQNLAELRLPLRYADPRVPKAMIGKGGFPGLLLLAVQGVPVQLKVLLIRILGSDLSMVDIPFPKLLRHPYGNHGAWLSRNGDPDPAGKILAKVIHRPLPVARRRQRPQALGYPDGRQRGGIQQAPRAPGDLRRRPLAVVVAALLPPLRRQPGIVAFAAVDTVEVGRTGMGFPAFIRADPLLGAVGIVQMNLGDQLGIASPWLAFEVPHPVGEAIIPAVPHRNGERVLFLQQGRDIVGSVQRSPVIPGERRRQHLVRDGTAIDARRKKTQAADIQAGPPDLFPDGELFSE